MKLYGETKQEGEPTPDNPKEIKNECFIINGNNEEQKAIELLKEEISRPVEVPEDKFNTFILYNIENTKIILNLISKLQADIEIKDKVIEEIKSKLQKHINFCEQESRGHLENKVCHISLKFEKNLLEEVEKVRDNLQEENE